MLDLHACDTVRIGCPICVNDLAVGDSFQVPIYLYNDAKIGAFSFPFRHYGKNLRFGCADADDEPSTCEFNFDGATVLTTSQKGGIQFILDEGAPDEDTVSCLLGWIDFSGTKPIAVNTTGAAKLLGSFYLVLTEATDQVVRFDTAFYPPAGQWIAYNAPTVPNAPAEYPMFVMCRDFTPPCDIAFGYTPDTPECSSCGDVDESSENNIADAVYMVNYIFGHGTPPQDASGGDFDCDLRVTIADVVYFINYIFVGGPKPCLGCEGPVITMFAAEPDTVEPNGVSHLTVSATDRSCQSLSYSYMSSGGSIVGHESDGATWRAPAIEGQYRVIATVANGSDETSDSVFLFVIAPPPARIMGTLVLPSGNVGDLEGIKVSVYTSVNNWAQNLFLRRVVASGSGSSATYVIDSLPTGTYFLDAWQDNNDNELIDDGDLYGWYGTGRYPLGSLVGIGLAQYEWRIVNVIVRSY